MAINFPAHPTDYISEIHGFSLVAVIFDNAKDTQATHLIRPNKIVCALQWLKENNPHYVDMHGYPKPFRQ